MVCCWIARDLPLPSEQDSTTHILCALLIRCGMSSMWTGEGSGVGGEGGAEGGGGALTYAWCHAAPLCF